MVLFWTCPVFTTSSAAIAVEGIMARSIVTAMNKLTIRNRTFFMCAPPYFILTLHDISNAARRS